MAMKSIITLLTLVLTLACGTGTAEARKFKVHGPQGGIVMDITLPKGFDMESGKCPMVILMHGIFSSGNIVPMPALAMELADAGIASMTAGILESRGEKPAGLVLIAPGSVIQDACRNGRLFGAEFNPADPVRLIHGSKDTIVPMSCSEKFVEVYGDRSELIVVEGENHMITRRKKEVVSLAVSFFKDLK